MFKFLHAADLHLDSPLRGLERLQDSAPLDTIRGATRRALENLVQLAIDEKVDFVLMVGDLYDGDWRDFNTGLFFVRQMTRLREARIPVYIVLGNHDAESEITKNLKMPDNVRRFDHKKAHTLRHETLPVALHGQSFSDRSVVKNLSEGYPTRVDGCFNIGLLHTSLSGREGHADYAPCTLDNLLARRYHYWALGHVHAREVVSRSPWIVFPGNTQGRHIRETGSKGCTLVTVHDDFSAEVVHKPLDVLRWELCSVDLTSALSFEQALSLARTQFNALLQRHPEHPLLVRVEFSGASPAHDILQRERQRFAAELKSLAIDLSHERLWLEKIKLKTRSPLEIAPELIEQSPLGPFLTSMRTLDLDHPVMLKLQEELKVLKEKLPEEVFKGAELSGVSDGSVERSPFLELTSPEQLRTELEAFLLPRLRAAMEVSS